MPDIICDEFIQRGLENGFIFKTGKAYKYQAIKNVVELEASEKGKVADSPLPREISEKGFLDTGSWTASQLANFIINNQVHESFFSKPDDPLVKKAVNEFTKLKNKKERVIEWIDKISGEFESIEEETVFFPEFRLFVKKRYDRGFNYHHDLIKLFPKLSGDIKKLSYIQGN